MAGSKAETMTIRERLRAERPGPVTITIPRDGNKPKYLLVSVNGMRYSIERGKSVTIPYNVYEVLENSAKSDEKVAEMVDKLSSNPSMQVIS